MANINDTVKLSGKASELEYVTNKTNKISDTPSNNKYPSEKAVADIVTELNTTVAGIGGDVKALQTGLGLLTDRVEDLENGGGSITVDDALSAESTNPVQNKVVAEAVKELDEKAVGAGTAASVASESAQYALQVANEANAKADELETKLGDIDAALYRIIAIQNELIGGGSV